MTILSDLKRADSLMTSEDMKLFVKPCMELPVASEENLGAAYVLVDFSRNAILGDTYRCIESGSGYAWEHINYREEGSLDKPTQVWANSKIESDSVTVKIHWNDPEDKDDAHWAFSVLMRKRGSAPQNPCDGEIVGVSSIRDQYAGKVGFVDEIDLDSVDDSDIIDNENSENTDVTNDYKYRVFAYTAYGKWTASDECGPMLTWEKFRELVREGIADHAVDLGDLVTINHAQFGLIDFEVVAFDNAELTTPDLTHSVTFMCKNVLFRGSFDHRETNDEGSPYHDGCNAWYRSNIRKWLNSDQDKDHWFDPSNPSPIAVDSNVAYPSHADTYPSEGSIRSSSYGHDGEEFDGFLMGFDQEVLAVMAEVFNTTTVPTNMRTEDGTIVDGTAYASPVYKTKDKIFLPSYYEVFGEANWPGDHLIAHEGKQFDIYRLRKTNTRLKEILPDFDTAPGLDRQTNLPTHLCSWYLRTPINAIDVEIGGGTKQCVEMVSCKNRRYDVVHELGEDAGQGRLPYMPLTAGSADDQNDSGRDQSKNTFTPVGTRLVFTNNTAPGFAPCFVVA